ECASKCYFGEKCKFLHDVEKYLSEKQEDIGPKCHLYETFGKCIYGVSCRFAKSHLGEDFKNLINQELVKQWEGKALVRNSLDKGLQIQLRKKKVPFDKTDKFLKLLNKSQKPTKVKGDAEPPPVTTDSLGDQLIAPPSTDCTKQVTGDGETKTVTVTSGALTDEDIIKLRPCEKKKQREPAAPAAINLSNEDPRHRLELLCLFCRYNDQAQSPIHFLIVQSLEGTLHMLSLDPRPLEHGGAELGNGLAVGRSGGSGNGDIFSFEDANRAMQTGVSGIMLARYIPVGLLERLPQKINERPPYYMGRDYMETLMASQNVGDWIKISEMLLGPVPPNFTFLPKHKANSYK
ncbi:hypothetical protein AB205_0011150, partial [Aquarana catesbeiana]